jgi:hypothetical protein
MRVILCLIVEKCVLIVSADPITQGKKPAEQNIVYGSLTLHDFPNNV